MPELPQKKTYRLAEICQYTDTQPYVLRARVRVRIGSFGFISAFWTVGDHQGQVRLPTGRSFMTPISAFVIGAKTRTGTAATTTSPCPALAAYLLTWPTNRPQFFADRWA